MKGLGLGLGLCYPCQYLVISCSDGGSFAVLGTAAVFVLDSKWHPEPVIPGTAIQIDASAARSMLGMESSSKPFSCDGSEAKSKSLVCYRAGALHNSAPDTLRHSERVQFCSDSDGCWGQGA